MLREAPSSGIALRESLLFVPHNACGTRYSQGAPPKDCDLSIIKVIVEFETISFDFDHEYYSVGTGRDLSDLGL